MTDIRTVGVLGSGTMGAGIGLVAARAGFKTIVYDLDPGILDRARRQSEGFLQKSVERGRLAAADLARIMGDLVGTTRLDDLASCDIVIEAVYESLVVKREVLGRLNT